MDRKFPTQCRGDVLQAAHQSMVQGPLVSMYCPKVVCKTLPAGNIAPQDGNSMSARDNLYLNRILPAY